MSPALVAVLIVGGTLIMDTIIVAALLKAAWGMLPRREGVRPAGDAIRRNFQSFKFGIYNLGMCIHVAVDDAYLHLFPAAVLRWAGARQVSVPWEDVEFLRRKGRKWAEVKIGKQKVMGPGWALEIAEGLSAESMSAGVGGRA
jgi:hypothetical protein